MKKYISIVATIAAVSFAVSCSKDIAQTSEPQNEEQTQQEEGLVAFEFTAVYPDMDITRTTVTDQGEVAWAEGDRISIYYLDNNVPSSTVAIAQGSGKSVKFSASIPAGVTEFYAVYPEGKGTLTTESVFTVKTDAACNGEFQNANIAAAYAKAGDAVVFKFQNVTGLFRIQLPADAAVSHAGGSTVISSIEITGKADELVLGGDVKVNVDQAGAISFEAPAEGYATSVKAVLSAAAVTGGYAYIPVLPFTSADGVTFKFEAADATVVPALLTKAGKSITLERGHIKPVEKAIESIVWDWYFSPEGTGDGKTASTPAGVETFEDMLNATSAPHFSWQLNGAVLHLGEGTYALTKQIDTKGTEPVKIVIEGAGKDATILDGAGISGTQMLLLEGAADFTISKLTVQNGKTSKNGGALSTNDATGHMTLSNCKFLNNQSTGGNSGAFYIGGIAGTDIIDCLFQDNESKTKGGAIAMGGSSAGEILIKNTTFKNNSAGTTADSHNGGAIYNANTSVTKVDNCTFDANQCYLKGGAVTLDKAGCKMFFNRCLFVGNVQMKDDWCDGAAIHNAAGKGSVGVFNCTFNYNHHKLTTKATGVFYSASYIVANSTFVESMKSSYGCVTNMATTDHVSTVMNNIIITTSTTATHCALSMKGKADNNHVDSGYNLITRIQENFTAASEEATNFTPVVKSNFGFADSVDKENKCYAWGGDFSPFTGFTKCTLADVEAKIKANTAIGAEFWNWLVSIGATDVDVRGVKRNTNAMWPGSYQQD